MFVATPQQALTCLQYALSPAADAPEVLCDVRSVSATRVDSYIHKFFHDDDDDDDNDDNDRLIPPPIRGGGIIIVLFLL